MQKYETTRLKLFGSIFEKLLHQKASESVFCYCILFKIVSRETIVVKQKERIRSFCESALFFLEEIKDQPSIAMYLLVSTSGAASFFGIQVRVSIKNGSVRLNRSSSPLSLEVSGKCRAARKAV